MDEVMYVVQWCDHEGNLRELRFESAEDAGIQADALRDSFGWAQVIQEEQ